MPGVISSAKVVENLLKRQGAAAAAQA
jgi:hypothetical protein